MTAHPILRPTDTVSADEALELYESVGWAAYTRDPDALAQAIANSTYLVEARSPSGVLIGLARAVSDDVSIFYLQDILVHPDWQRQGIGTALLHNCLDRFNHVRQKVLLTDDLPAQHRFYRSMGYRDTRDIEEVELHTFVRIDGGDSSTAS